MITWPRCVAMSVFLSSLVISGQLASAQTVDDAFRSNIEELIEVSGTQRISAQVVAILTRQMLDGLKKSQPNLPEQAIDFAVQVMNEELTKGFLTPELMSRMVPLFAKHFTPDEVRGLIAFYRSDLGRKYVGSMPTLMQETSAATQQYTKEVMPNILEAVKRRLAEYNK
jgi:uncharacterized protein